MKEFGEKFLASFTPISAEEAEKFYKPSFEMAKATNSDLFMANNIEVRLIYSVGWYAIIKEQK